MSRVGQCPSCRTIYELDDDAIGHVIDCQCGAALFVCDVAGFSEIPVCCTACGGEYVVDGDGAGEIVACECGENLTVPTAVLRQPISTNEENAVAVADAPSAGDDEDADDQVVQCPKCRKKYSVLEEDIGDEAECSCGCVFGIKRKQNGALIAQTIKASSASSAAEKDADEEDEGKPARRKKPVSLLNVIGVAAVGLLLLVSIIMFVTRNRGRELAEADKTERDGTGTPNKTPGAAAKPAPAAPKTDGGSTDSFRPPVMSPTAVTNRTNNTSAARPIPDPGPAAAADGGSSLALLAPPPDPPLPQPKPARAIVPIIPSGNRGLTFDRAYAEAFKAYEETNRLKTEAEQSGDAKAYHKQLGTTIGLLQQTLNLATRQAGNDKIDELRYLLAYLNFTAGRLAESAIYGGAVARWGDVGEAATQEAAMIALAATQEANETGWGDAGLGGELHQMRSVAEIIAERWPDHEQLDVIWMSLGQRYVAYGDSPNSANAYGRVSENSSHYGAAQLAAGRALWAQFRKNHAEGDDPFADPQQQLLELSDKLLSKGVEVVSTATKKPTVEIMSAKLSLAGIAMMRGDLESAESWLVDPPMSVVESIVVSNPADGNVKVSEGFLRPVFQTLFTIRTQQRDPAGAKAALEMMAGKLGSDAADFGKMFLSVAKDYIQQLVASPVVNREQFSTLSELIEPLKEHESTLTVSNVLWLGESWSKLAERARTPKLAQQCYGKAAAAYALAMNRSDFPAASRQAASIRRIELLRSSGELVEVVPMLESILKKSPNAFDVQIEAAETLQQLASDSSQPEQLAAAIDGPDGSPIWGWAKLVTTLHAASGADESDKQRDRLLKCQYNLAECQYLLAKASSDSTERDKLLSGCRRSLDRLVATTSPDREPWYSRLQELQKQASKDL